MELLNMAWNVVGTAGGGAVRRNPWLRRWPGVAAVVVLLLLLTAYQSVVRDGVRSGASRRVAVAAQEQAQRRCTALDSRSERDGCRLRIDAASGVEVLPSMPVPAADVALLR